jgi:hypothetical protein
MLKPILTFSTVCLFSLSLVAAPLPDIKMPDNGLPFQMIEGYQDYKIVATHWRIDKHELRYVLANPIAYKALQNKQKPLPEGSKMVKIGWSVKPMTAYSDALEADKLQRIEFMVKDSKHFDQKGDHWGYARFVKKGDSYVSYENGSAECIGCHASVSQDDYLFTTFQAIF